MVLMVNICLMVERSMKQEAESMEQKVPFGDLGVERLFPMLLAYALSGLEWYGSWGRVDEIVPSTNHGISLV